MNLARQIRQISSFIYQEDYDKALKFLLDIVEKQQKQIDELTKEIRTSKYEQGKENIMQEHELVPIPTNYKNMKIMMEDDDTMYKYFGFKNRKQVKELSLDEFIQKVRYGK